MRAINPGELEIFQNIRKASNAVIVSTEFEGRDAVVIAFVTHDGEDSIITPVALMIDEDDTLGIYPRLAPPDKDLE